MLISLMGILSKYAIAFMIVFIVLFGMFKRVKLFEAFTEGAKEAYPTAIRIIPHLIAMLVAIGVFRESGAMDILIKALRPLMDIIKMPAELLPMALMRPLSGGGAQGMMAELINANGPESLNGRMAAIMMGSTETTFYVLTVYFGAVGIKKQRHALTTGLIADCAGLIAAVIVTRLFFHM